MPGPSGPIGPQGPQGIEGSFIRKTSSVKIYFLKHRLASQIFNSRSRRTAWPTRRTRLRADISIWRNASYAWSSGPTRTTWTAWTARDSRLFQMTIYSAKSIRVYSGPRGEMGFPGRDGRDFQGLSDRDIELIVRHPLLKVRLESVR